MLKLTANRVDSSRAALKLCRGKSTICSAESSGGAGGRAEQPKEFVILSLQTLRNSAKL